MFGRLFVSDARRVVAVAFSFWLQAIAVLALVVPEVLFVLTGRDLDPAFLWFVQVGLAVAGLVSRVIVQPAGVLKNWFRLILLVALIFAASAMAARAETAQERAFLTVAVPFVGSWEGKSNAAYLDTIASPPVWTICHGETRGVRQGDYRTDAQCAAMLAEGLLTFRNGLHDYFTAQTKAQRLTPHRDAAYVSLAYNAGIRAIGRSTATRRLNAGDIRGGCEALSWWNKAGGRVIRGLVNRRTAERDLCLRGL